MKYLLDTHVLLWIVEDNPQLSDKVKAIYLEEENEMILSIASVWEIAIKSSLNKLDIPGSLKEFVKKHIRGNNINILPIELSHLYQLEKLPFHHRDPFDRLIIAQGMMADIAVISKDKIFDAYLIKREW